MRSETRFVDNANFHIWTDALHARELARKGRDPWNGGIYVRWAVNSAWTAFEMACEDALESRLRRDFWGGLDEAVANKTLSKLDRSQGIWSSVARIHDRRRNYTHPGLNQTVLFAPVEEAEDAIRILRDAIKSIYAHAGKPVPKWVEADPDMGWPGVPVARDVLRHAGVTEDMPNVIRVAYVREGRQYDSDILPPGSDWRPGIIQIYLMDADGNGLRQLGTSPERRTTRPVARRVPRENLESLQRNFQPLATFSPPKDYVIMTM